MHEELRIHEEDPRAELGWFGPPAMGRVSVRELSRGKGSIAWDSVSSSARNEGACDKVPHDLPPHVRAGKDCSDRRRVELTNYDPGFSRRTALPRVRVSDSEQREPRCGIPSVSRGGMRSCRGGVRRLFGLNFVEEGYRER